MTNGTSFIQDVLETYKRAVYESDVEKFLSIRQTYIFMTAGETGSVRVSLYGKIV